MKSAVLAGVAFVWVLVANGQAADFRSINFAKADSVALSYPNYSLHDLRKLSHTLTSTLNSDVEKFRALYRWVCENIGYDYPLFKKNQHQREKLRDPVEIQQWNRKMNALAFKALLREHKTVCTGYAYLLRELARFANIPCEMVDGYGRTATTNIGSLGEPNHQWTRVQLNGQWYLADATWSSGSMSMPSGTYVKEFNDAYFLMDPQLFIRNHYPLETQWTLLENPPTLQQFITRPIVYSQSMLHKITRFLPDTLDITVRKKEPMHIQFNAESSTFEMVTVTINNQLTNAHASLTRDASGFYSIQYQFSGTGFYVMNVNQAGKPLFSYRVRVLK